MDSCGQPQCFTGFADWGAGYFAINDAGRVEVRPNGPNSTPVDLYEQVDELRKSGLFPAAAGAFFPTSCKTVYAS